MTRLPTGPITSCGAREAYLGPAWTYVVVGLVALVATVGYTGDLEMAWLAAMLFVPTLALVVGAVVGFLAHLRFGSPRRAVLAIAAFSLVFHTGLMIEEMGVGLIRHQFAHYAQKLSAAERAAPVHEVRLGDDHVLYFADTTDTSFRLNFEYQGQAEVSRDELLSLARSWLSAYGYRVSNVKLSLWPPTYRKSGFSLKHPGQISVGAEVIDGPKKDGRVPSTVCLQVMYDQGFLFKATAWAFSAP